MTFDPTSAALGAVIALLGVMLIATPLLASIRKAMQEARDTITAQQQDIDSLFEITPARLPNGRFAKRQ